jgi:hypothetical protein
MIRPTPFDDIPAYLGAVTLLQPEGNVAAEVSAALEEWERPDPADEKPDGPVSKVGGLLTFIVTTVVLAIGLGTLFSFVYPTVGSDFGLASVFLLIAATIVLAGREIWRATRRSRRFRRWGGSA